MLILLIIIKLLKKHSKFMQIYFFSLILYYEIWLNKISLNKIKTDFLLLKKEKLFNMSIMEE